MLTDVTRDQVYQVYEAGAGIEPANRGFADLGLTTWLPRRVARERNYRMQAEAVNLVTATIAAGVME